MKAHHNVQNIVARLSRIEGHVRGIKKMLEEGKSCEEILIQISAVKAALNNAGKMVLDDHFNHCIVEKVKGKITEKELFRFKEALDKYLK